MLAVIWTRWIVSLSRTMCPRSRTSWGHESRRPELSRHISPSKTCISSRFFSSCTRVFFRHRYVICILCDDTFYLYFVRLRFVNLCYHWTNMNEWIGLCEKYTTYFQSSTEHKNRTDTHDNPRRLVRRLDQHARFASRGCPLGMRACTRVNVYCTR